MVKLNIPFVMRHRDGLRRNQGMIYQRAEDGLALEWEEVRDR